MKITKTLLENSVVELILEETAENIVKNRSKAIAHLEKNADISGFRKGAKIPESVLVRKFGEEHITQMTIDFAIDTMYRKAMTSEKLLPVAQGEIKEIISESPLQIRVHIEVFPTVEIDKKFDKISLKKTNVSTTAAEVKAALAEIETKFTKFEATDSKTAKAKMGERVTLDTQGYEDGKELANTAMQAYPIILGSNILVPGFEEEVVGMKIGEIKEFPVVFPADYHNTEFAGKKSTFKVTVHGIEKAVKPEFTETFIEELRGKKLDLAGFKDLIKEEITETKLANVRMEEESQLIDELLKISTVPFGPKLLATKIDQVFGEIKENLAGDKVKMSDYLESLKMTEEEYKDKNITPVATKRLQGELILQKLTELRPIEVTDTDMKIEIDTVLAKFQAENVLERLKELYVPGTKYYEELRQRMTYRKIIESFFVEKAVKQIEK